MTTASIGMWVLIALIVFVLILVKKSLVIIPQSETKIIERLGKYYATLKPGINVIIPFIDRPKNHRGLLQRQIFLHQHHRPA